MSVGHATVSRLLLLWVRVGVAVGRRRRGGVSVETVGDLPGQLQVLLSGLQAFLAERLQILAAGFAEDGEVIDHRHVGGDLSVDVALIELGSLLLRKLLRHRLQTLSVDLLLELYELPRTASLIHVSVLAGVAVRLARRLAGDLVCSRVRIRTVCLFSLSAGRRHGCP